MAYNIYCDESCHLRDDKEDIMVLGAIKVACEQKEKVYEDIRSIKKKHGISSWCELKWTKVSESKIKLYEDVIDYFFQNENLEFRCVVATGKKELDHNKYNEGSYDLWYYKMYYRLLNELIVGKDSYSIHVDRKDTKGFYKVKKLHEILCNNIYDFKQEIIKQISEVSSHESEAMQMTDLLIGAVSYYHRKQGSQSKLRLVEKIQNEYHISLSESTYKNHKKFNVFIWEPKRC